MKGRRSVCEYDIHFERMSIHFLVYVNLQVTIQAKAAVKFVKAFED